MDITTWETRGMSSDIRATDRRAPAGGWRRATVREVAHPTPRGVLLRLEVHDRMEHMAGQHYVVRLTAPDGYVAQRSYSVASPPSDPLCEFFVEQLDNGEVSTYLCEEVRVGDVLDVRGPIGGWFVWDGISPAMGIAGGTGVVPLVSMLRHARALGHDELLHLVVSARTMAELPYADELINAGSFIALTREAGPGGRSPGRLHRTEIASRLAPRCTYFVCGSAGFAESVSTQLVDSGVEAGSIRVERFGPSG
ncbi:MAG: FAD-binding oxidoreductase [Actinomycetota bacterium]